MRSASPGPCCRSGSPRFARSPAARRSRCASAARPGRPPSRRSCRRGCSAARGPRWPRRSRCPSRSPPVRASGARRHPSGSACPCRPQPPGDRLVETRVSLVRVREVDRLQRPGLRPGRDRRQELAYISRSPAPAAFAGSGADPRDRRHVEVGHQLAERHPVLVDRARGVDLQHDHGALGFGTGEPVVQVGQERPVDRALDPERRRPGCSPPRRRLSPATTRAARGRTGTGPGVASAHRTRRQARGILGATPMAGASHTPRTDLRPLTDRPAFKPFAVLLIVPIVLLASGLMAIILAPPFAGIAFGAHRVQAKLDRLGADFTRIPRFPERSTIYASDGTTVLATVYLDNREIVRLKKIAPIAREGGARDRGLRLLRARRAELELAGAGPRRELPGGRGRAGRVDDHAAAREEHDRRQRRADLRAQVPGARARAPRRGEVLEGRDLRDVPERDLHGERDLRDRDGGGVLLRQARLRAHPRRGRAARRHGPRARVLRPARPPPEGAAAAQRRAEPDGGRRHHQADESRQGEGEGRRARATTSAS